MHRFFTYTLLLFVFATTLGFGAATAQGQTSDIGTATPSAGFSNVNLPTTPSFGGSTSGGTAVGNTADTTNLQLSGDVGNTTVSNTYDTAVSPQAQAAAQTVNAQIVPQAGCVSGKDGTTLVDNIYGCIGYIVHYILFSPMAWFMGVMGVFLNLVVQEFIVSFGSQTTIIATVTEGWQIFRDLANMLIIFFLLLTGIATILRLEQWGWRKFLSRVIIAALIINFSLFITKVVIDTSNLFTAQIYSAILTKAYGGQNGILAGNGAGSTRGQVSCLEDRATRLAALAGNTGNSATNVSSNSLSEGLLEDPCVSAGLSGAFTSVLRMTTLMTVPAGWQGAVGAGGNVEFAVTSESFLIINLLGAFMFLTLALIFGAMAIMLLIRWVVLIMLMLFSPIWMIGLVFGHGGKKYWDRLIENAIFPPLFFIMVYASYIIANGMKVAVNSNSTATGEVASYTLIAAGQGGWYLLLHFVLVILMLIYAMKWALEAGDETARAGGFAALGVGASVGYLGWKGAKATGGYTWDKTVGSAAGWLQRKADARAQAKREAGSTSLLYNSMMQRGVSKMLGRFASGQRGRMESKRKSILESNQRGKGAMLAEKFTSGTFTQSELAEMNEGQINEAIRLVGVDRVMKSLQHGTHTFTRLDPTTGAIVTGHRSNADGLKSGVMEAIQKSDQFTAIQKKGLLNSKFGGLSSLFTDLKRAEAERTSARGTPQADAADLAYKNALELYQDAIQKLSTGELKMFGESRYLALSDEERETMAEAFTPQQVKWINTESDWGFNTREQVRDDRYGDMLEAFKQYLQADRNDPAVYEQARLTFSHLLNKFTPDELAYSGVDDLARRGDTTTSNENVVRLTEAISQKMYDNITRTSSPWSEGFKKQLGQAKLSEVTKIMQEADSILESRDATDPNYGDYVAKISAVADKLRQKIRSFGLRDFELMSDAVVSASGKANDVLAMALRGPQLDDFQKALGPTHGSLARESRKTMQVKMLASTDPVLRGRFDTMYGKVSAADLLKEDKGLLAEEEMVKRYTMGQLQNMSALPQETKDKIIQTIDDLLQRDIADPTAGILSPQQKKNFENIKAGLDPSTGQDFFRGYWS